MSATPIDTTTQNFLVDPGDYSSINHSNYLSVVGEIARNNPQKYAQTRSNLKTNFAAAIHRETYFRFYLFLTLGKAASGESYLTALGSANFIPAVPKQLASKIALEQAETALRCALQSIDTILPPDGAAASRLYVGNDVPAVNPVVPATV